jgi:hypothetical protein
MTEVIISTIEDFNLAKNLIEQYNDSLPKLVSHHGKPRFPDPNLDIPYTDYNVDDLSILADEMIIEILNDNDISYTPNSSDPII